MKRVLLILSLCLILNSCLTPGAPHGHSARNIDHPDSAIGLTIGCTPGKKSYRVCGTAQNDSVYISSRKLHNRDNLSVGKYFLCGGAAKSFTLMTGDHKFHRHVLDDTITVKIVKADGRDEVHRFLIDKDHYIRS